MRSLHFGQRPSCAVAPTIAKRNKKNATTIQATTSEAGVVTILDAFFVESDTEVWDRQSAAIVDCGRTFAITGWRELTLVSKTLATATPVHGIVLLPLAAA